MNFNNQERDQESFLEKRLTRNQRRFVQFSINASLLISGSLSNIQFYSAPYLTV